MNKNNAEQKNKQKDEQKKSIILKTEEDKKDLEVLKQHYIMGIKNDDIYNVKSEAAVNLLQKNFYSILIQATPSNDFERIIDSFKEFYQTNVVKDVFGLLPEQDVNFVNNLYKIRAWSGGLGKTEEIKDPLNTVKDFIKQKEVPIILEKNYTKQLIESRVGNLLRNTRFKAGENNSTNPSDENIEKINSLVEKIDSSYKLIDENIPLGAVYSLAPLFNELNMSKLSNLNDEYIEATNKEDLETKSNVENQFNKSKEDFESHFEKLLGKSYEDYVLAQDKSIEDLVVLKSNKALSFTLYAIDENKKKVPKGIKNVLLSVDYYPEVNVLELQALQGEREPSFNSVYELDSISHYQTVPELFDFKIFAYSDEREQLFSNENYFNGFVKLPVREPAFLSEPSIKKLAFDMADSMRNAYENSELIPVNINYNVVNNLRAKESSPLINYTYNETKN